MKSMIVVEGPHFVGKTTVSKQIVAQLSRRAHKEVEYRHARLTKSRVAASLESAALTSARMQCVLPTQQAVIPVFNSFRSLALRRDAAMALRAPRSRSVVVIDRYVPGQRLMNDYFGTAIELSAHLDDLLRRHFPMLVVYLTANRSTLREREQDRLRIKAIGAAGNMFRGAYQWSSMYTDYCLRKMSQDADAVVLATDGHSPPALADMVINSAANKGLLE